MQHDRTITITTGGSRKATRWSAQRLTVSALWEKLRAPTRSTETLAEFLNYPKAQQDELKDTGGYVAGTLRGPRRKADAVAGRDLITLDLDQVPPGGTEAVMQQLGALGCGYCVHSTRKHRPEAPRLRVLLPLDRTVTADEYQPISRKLAQKIGLDWCDPSTFEVHRLMYWPSCCADGEYIYQTADLPPVSADAVLAEYEDWRQVRSWPQIPGADTGQRLAAKQEDPLTKPGLIGAFCRAYTLEQAMEELLPGVYGATDVPDRYTYLAGSTAGGAVLYESGRFLYSHHATDPCGGRLVNAFDLVRLHKFGALDEDKPEDTPVGKLPSYQAMEALAVSLPAVKAQIVHDRIASAEQDFAGLALPRETEEDFAGLALPRETEEDDAWMADLSVTSRGEIRATVDNIWIILEHDARLRDKFALNKFAGRGEVLGDTPWATLDGRRRLWEDTDNAGLYWYLEKVYGISGNGKVDDALALHTARHAFDDVVDYLNGLTWDGVPRLDTLFIDYLGAEDTEYTRAVTRKIFTAAVARAMVPGCKFDQMLILSGPQGLGKSTLLDTMSRGWFNDSIRTFEGKDASELLQGVWLVEIAELDAFRRTDVARIKQFLSLRADRFRAAYGRHVKDLPRRCVFFGTTNSGEYLQDRTGNRRFWPVDVGRRPAEKSVWRDLPGEVDSLWAEAVIRWRLGESLLLPDELEKVARAQQEAHTEQDSRAGLILEFLERKVPADWQKWTLDKRRTFWAGGVSGEEKLVPRDRVCAMEVWCEALGGNVKDLKYADSVAINAVIESAGGWERPVNPGRFGPYGKIRGFFRIPKS